MKCILSIETSCDETGFAIVGVDGKVLFDQTKTQLIHKKFSGVIPELASREHIIFIQEIWNEAKQIIIKNSLDIIAVSATSGPGLIGSLLTGIMFAKGLSFSMKIPFIPINHLEGHIMSLAIKSKNEQLFIEKIPNSERFITLLISGGHCQFLIRSGFGSYDYLGGSIDDSIGEAFDKVARMLSLEYPGGPEIEKMAKNGNINSFKLPMPLCNKENCDMSFSGLKTAVYYLVKEKQKNGDLTQELICDLSASFQHTVAKIIVKKTNIAVKQFKEKNGGNVKIFVCGGVSANNYIKNYLENNIDGEILYPIQKYSTDNGLMIASAAFQYYHNNKIPDIQDIAKSRWPLKDILIKDFQF
jgi:N6-L-threonylcarbamoyladenine synthase